VDVVVDSWAWLKKSDLTPDQVVNMERMLTVHPKKTGNYPGEEPEPIPLYVNEKDRFGVPREFFFSNRRPTHNIELQVTEGSEDWWPAEFVGTLRPEQKMAVDEVVAMFGAGRLGGIIQAKPGFGKTVVALALVARLGLPAMVVVHKEFLMDQWTERIKKFLPAARVGRVQQNVCDFRGKTIVMGMVHSLGGEQPYPEDLWTWPGIVFTDESLSEHARILTRTGWQTIGSLVKGDEEIDAVAFDEARGVFEWRPITKRWRHTPKSPMLRITHERGVLECTARHEVLTSFGYRQAGELVPRVDCVVCCSNVESGRLTKRSESFDCGLNDGGRVPHTNETRRQGAVSGSALGRTGRFSGFQISGVTEPCSNSSEDCREQGVGERDSTFHYSISSQSFGTSSGILSRGRESSQRELAERELVRCGDGVVGDGRRISKCQRPGAQAPHGGFQAPEGSRTGFLADRNFRGQGKRKGGAKILGAFAERRGVEDRGKSDRSVRYSVDALQSRPGSQPSDKAVCDLWGRNFVRDGREIREQKVLQGPEMSAGVPCTSVGAFSRDSERDCYQIRAALLRGMRCGDRYYDSPLFEENDMLEVVPSDLERPGSTDKLLRASEGVADLHTAPSRVLRVECIDSPEFVYDLTVEERHNFVVDGVVAHNCHRIGARTWSAVPPRFLAKFRVGLTATPRRKDLADDVFWNHIGPILFAGKEQRLKVQVKRVWTKFKLAKTDRFNPNLAPQSLLFRFLCGSRYRNDLIVDQIANAVASGRKCLVLSMRLNHLQKMEDMLRKRWPSGEGEVSIGHYVGGRKKEQLERSAQARVIFATSQFAAEGLDIPAMDTLFLTVPMSDVEQAVGRIQRPFASKKDPIVVDFRDDTIPMFESMGRKRDRFYQKVT